MAFGWDHSCQIFYQIWLVLLWVWSVEKDCENDIFRSVSNLGQNLAVNWIWLVLKHTNSVYALLNLLTLCKLVNFSESFSFKLIIKWTKMVKIDHFCGFYSDKVFIKFVIEGIEDIKLNHPIISQLIWLFLFLNLLSINLFKLL